MMNLTEYQIKELEYCFSLYPKNIEITQNGKYSSFKGIMEQLDRLYELDDKVGLIYYISRMIPADDGTVNVEIKKFVIRK